MFLRTMAWSLNFKVCLNGSCLHMDNLLTCLSDPGNLVGGNEDDLEFLLLSFNTKNNKNKWLLETAFGLPRHGYYAAKVPVLMEIRDAIAACKPTVKSRAPRSRTEVVAVAVRDHNFLVLSDPRGVTLAFRKHENNTLAPEDLELLQWFLEALERDVLAVLDLPKRLVGVADEKVADDPDLEKAPEDSEVQPAKGEGDEVPGDSDSEDSEAPPAKRTKVQKYTDTALVHIREHAKCSSASWQPSRGSFLINMTGKIKAKKEFPIPKFAKLLKEAEVRGDDRSWLLVNDKISNKATDVLGYLDEIPVA